MQLTVAIRTRRSLLSMSEKMSESVSRNNEAILNLENTASTDAKIKNKTFHVRMRRGIQANFIHHGARPATRRITRGRYILFTVVDWLVTIIIYLACIGVAIYFCLEMWDKYNESPTMKSFASSQKTIGNIPFPAIAICPTNKVSKARLKERQSENPKLRDIDYRTITRTLRYMTKMSRTVDREKDVAYLTDFYREKNITNTELFKLLKKSVPTCRDIVKDCSWLGDTESCFDYLDLLPTDNGLCCVFNGANYSDPDLGIVSKPRDLIYVNDISSDSELALILDGQNKDYAVKNDNYNGFKILVHASQKFPDVDGRGFLIAPGFTTSVKLTATVEDPKQDVLAMAPGRRKCKTDDEGATQFFRNYSQSGCIVECASRIVKESFNCRPYFLLAENGTSLCDLALFPKIHKKFVNVKQHPDKYKCDCIPPCADEWFNPQVTAAPFPGEGFRKTRTFKRLISAARNNASTLVNSYMRSNMAELRVSYKERIADYHITEIRFGLSDFISAMGGLVGLGCGACFLSVSMWIYKRVKKCCFPLGQLDDDMDEFANSTLSCRICSNRIRYPTEIVNGSEQKDNNAKKKNRNWCGRRIASKRITGLSQRRKHRAKSQ